MLVFVLVSQPFAAMRSQSPKPASQALYEHAPPTHRAVALMGLHALPQAPQWVALVDSEVSQPLVGLRSQSANPALHEEYVHSPLEHTATAFAGAHSCPQRPQFESERAVSTSQPLLALRSQSEKPTRQASIEHVPFEQRATALG
jgi:hypothetical protein